jgi:hypothetical protein
MTSTITLMTADCQYYTEAAAERTRLTSMPLKVAIDEPLKALNFWSRVQGDVVLQRLDGSLNQLSMSLFVGDIRIPTE